jgi:hypothetical protein
MPKTLKAAMLSAVVLSVAVALYAWPRPTLPGWVFQQISGEVCELPTWGRVTALPEGRRSADNYAFNVYSHENVVIHNSWGSGESWQCFQQDGQFFSVRELRK